MKLDDVKKNEDYMSTILLKALEASLSSLRIPQTLWIILWKKGGGEDRKSQNFQ